MGLTMRSGRERARLGLQVMREGLVYIWLCTALVRMTFKLRPGTDVKEKEISRLKNKGEGFVCSFLRNLRVCKKLGRKGLLPS